LAGDVGVDDETARDLAVGIADQLIYERGIRSVGMDDIRDASGVSLKRLYRLFPAKEQLAEAALRHREAAFTACLAARVEAMPDPRERLLAVFDHLQVWFNEPDFRGCPFVNAWGEAGAAGGVADAVADQKRALRAFLDRLVAAVDGLAPAVADQLFILANGAMVAAATLKWPEAAGEARAAAAILLGAQLDGGDASVHRE
jgi:AcrR family transcriptional regulator